MRRQQRTATGFPAGNLEETAIMDHKRYIAGFNHGYEAAKARWFTIGFCTAAAVAAVIMAMLR